MGIGDTSGIYKAVNTGYGYSSESDALDEISATRLGEDEND